MIMGILMKKGEGEEDDDPDHDGSSMMSAIIGTGVMMV